MKTESREGQRGEEKKKKRGKKMQKFRKSVLSEGNERENTAQGNKGKTKQLNTNYEQNTERG